jgi:predicted secreted acid phosphatase
MSSQATFLAQEKRHSAGSLPTTLSNWNEMGGTNFEYDGKAFNARVESVQAPAIPGTLRIYSAAQRLGVRVFLLTGRPEARRAFTDTNLQLRGFSAWQQLILRKPEQAKMTALEYKSGECAKIAAAGYRINPQRRRSLERSARQA